uniref:G-protein coupled receptors family 1 profile domain-containing protein n=1 Tax=Esox lucius TaxID=8010 RepID=A0A3P8YGJ0_ESOLU
MFLASNRSTTDNCVNLSAPGGHSESTSGTLQSTTVKVCVVCILLPIPVLAILGNILIWASVVRFRSLQTPTNSFIVSLATADFLVAVLVMPFSLVGSVGTWCFGQNFCVAHFLLDLTLCTTSIFNLSCVALDRYVAVCDPLHYPARMSTRRVTLLLFLSWLIPLLVSSLCVSLGTYSLNAPSGHRGARQESQTCVAQFHTPYAVAVSTVCFFIPVLFMLFAYGKIFMAAQRQARWIHAIENQVRQLHTAQNPSRDDPNQPHPARRVGARVGGFSIRKEKKAARTLGLIMGVFLLCWLPHFSVNIAFSLWGTRISPVVLDAFMWLGYANSSLNPFIYASFNKDFRHAFAAILGFRILGRRIRGCLVATQEGNRVAC